MSYRHNFLVFYYVCDEAFQGWQQKIGPCRTFVLKYIMFIDISYSQYYTHMHSVVNHGSLLRYFMLW